MLNEHPLAKCAFEVKIQKWADIFQCDCSQVNDNCTSDIACGPSVNAFLKKPDRTAHIMNELGGSHHPRLIVQLRWNVVEKAISAFRLFTLKSRTEKVCGSKVRGIISETRVKCVKDFHHNTPVKVNSVQDRSYEGLISINGTIEAVMYAEQEFGVATMFVFYEDLMRDSFKTQAKVEEFLGLPITDHAGITETPTRFRDLSMDVINFGKIQTALSVDAYLHSMLFPEFNMNVNTVEQLSLLRSGLKPRLSYGHW